MQGLRVLLARVKRKIFKKPFIKDKKYPPFWFNEFLEKENAFLVQIGSNDGKTGDPIFPLLKKNKTWKALFVEPVPSIFKKLKANYPDSQRFTFENVAINEGQSMSFYWVDPKAKETLTDLPYWFDQLGSFDKQHILKHFDGALEPYIRTEVLEGIKLTTLLLKNSVSVIDVLHIDTEGYDWKILSQLELNQFAPKFIMFEQQHLSFADHQEAIRFLSEKYCLFNSGIDMLAVNKSCGTTFIDQMKKHMEVIK